MTAAVDTSRLSKCGWDSFRIELFLGEPGRRTRDVASHFLSILEDFCHGQSVLELCCGAGRLCIEMAKAGYAVTGIDLDRRMLAVARQAASQEPPATQARLRFVQGDVTHFDLGERFDFIVFEDDGFAYLLDREDQLACLAQVHRHLKPDGRFLLVFATPQRELDEARARDVLSCDRFEYDPVRQVKTCRCSWTVENEHGNRAEVREGKERRRLTYPCELELLLKTSGLHVVERWGDLSRTPFRSPEVQDYHYLCQHSRSG